MEMHDGFVGEEEGGGAGSGLLAGEEHKRGTGFAVQQHGRGPRSYGGRGTGGQGRRG